MEIRRLVGAGLPLPGTPCGMRGRTANFIVTFESSLSANLEQSMLVHLMEF